MSFVLLCVLYPVRGNILFIRYDRNRSWKSQKWSGKSLEKVLNLVLRKVWEPWEIQNRIRTDGRIDLSIAFVPRNIPFIAVVAVFRLVLKRVWRDIWDSRNGGHCLLTVGGRLRGVKIGAECVKYAWLSCPVRPSRWVLCISVQWLRLKGCHVACDECPSGEICSRQHMWVTGLSYGQSRVARH